MAQDESVRVWILTVESELEGRSETHYFYRLGASYDDLVRTLQTAGFQVAPDRTLNDDGLVRVVFLTIYKNHPRDMWAVGSGGHRYHLQDADRQATIEALLGVELQHATRITDAVEGALGSSWDLWVR
jgi:hypothetical protein